MKTPITKQIADRLEELAVQWKDHTSQAEALMMAAKEVVTFQEKEKEQMCDFAEQWFVCFGYKSVEDYFDKVFNTKERWK